ncbi:MAG TPA: response regulator [Haliscomenobacter sp.]|uniref:response regulator n=1 Tax=Haliscomenobacter sp. TaxID=2717303 RepID=UPI001DE9B059|nr:response regulator [Haliscomenobacter sp.]MBK9490823.1 response regulator transcription factor [Haliscomenobacter sp.]HOY16464.1 response regulator [Haliscomenobacter sp.]HPH19434.1 response regulator [Haliscomenobacter sp.]
MEKIHVAIVEDLTEFRERYSRLINLSQEFVCLPEHQFSCCEDSVPTLIEDPRIKVVIQDIGMPKGHINGIASMQQIKNKRQGLLFMIATVYIEDTYLFEALCAGADSYMLKTDPDAVFVHHLKELALENGRPFSGPLMRKILDVFRSQESDNNKIKPTAFQKQLLEKILEGEINEISYTNEELAEELNRQVKEITREIRAIYKMLHVNNRKEMIKKYQSWKVRFFGFD